MDYSIWAISGRFCGKVICNQVYDNEGHHIGYLYNGLIISAKDGKVLGEFYAGDRVGLKMSKSYPIKDSMKIRHPKKFKAMGSKDSIQSSEWVDPEF